MNARELRIGNYAYLIADGHEDEPDLLKWEQEDYDYYQNKMEYIKPIPIAEEELLWIGFNKVENDIPTYSKCFGDLIIDDYEYSFNIYVDSEQNYFITVLGNKIIIKHIHQLQNLYFAITGKELISENTTPKNGAKELVDKMLSKNPNRQDGVSKIDIIQANLCALVAVDEILKVIHTNMEYEYWNEVKKELNKFE